MLFLAMEYDGTGTQLSLKGKTACEKFWNQLYNLVSGRKICRCLILTNYSSWKGNPDYTVHSLIRMRVKNGPTCPLYLFLRNPTQLTNLLPMLIPQWFDNQPTSQSTIPQILAKGIHWPKISEWVLHPHLKSLTSKNKLQDNSGVISSKSLV